MDRTKYIGMDVHQASISIAVRDASGKLVMESLIETKAATIALATRFLLRQCNSATEQKLCFGISSGLEMPDTLRVYL